MAVRYSRGSAATATPGGPAIFRLREHVRRMQDSAKIYRMDLPFSVDQLCEGMLELVRVNRMQSCYIRPIALRARTGKWVSTA